MEKHRPIQQKAPPFVGREEVLEELDRVMAEVDGGVGAFVLLAGEAGVGKTALAHKVMDIATGKGWAVMAGECMVGKSLNPYYPLVQAFKGFQEKEGNALYDHGRSKPHGAGRGEGITMPVGLIGVSDDGPGGEGPAPSVEISVPVPEAKSSDDFVREKGRMFKDFSDLLEKVSKTRPVMVFIDDLQRAEDATIQLLDYLVTSMANRRVLFIGAYRNEEGGSPERQTPFFRMRLRFHREGHMRQIDVGRFGPAETELLLAAISPTRLQPTTIRKVHDQTGGNPFYIREYMDALLEKGSGAGSGTDGKATAIPTTVSAFITERLQRLGEDDLKVLQFGAIIGQEFSYDLLLRSIEMPEEDLVHVMERLISQHMVNEWDVSGEIRYSFVDNLVREVVYGNLSRSKRRFLHRTVGTKLEEMSRDPNGAAAAYPLAYHFSRSPDLIKALKYNMLAGNSAMATLATVEARGYYETALDLLTKVESVEGADEVELDILNKLGRVLGLLGEWKEALERQKEALNLCKEGTKAFATTHLLIAESEMDRGLWRMAFESLKRALKTAEVLGDTRLKAYCYRGLAFISGTISDHDKVIMYGTKAIEEARRMKDAYLEGKTLIDVANSFNQLRSDRESALKLYSEALRVLDPQRHADQVARAYNNIGDVFTKQGDYRKAITYFQKCLEIVDRTADLDMKGYGFTNIGSCLIKLGQVEDARVYIDEGLRIFEKVDNRYMLSMIRLELAMLSRSTGDMEMAEAHVKKAYALLDGTDFPYGYGNIHREHGILLKAKGDVKGALGELQKAFDIFSKSGATADSEAIKKEMEGLKFVEKGRPKERHKEGKGKASGSGRKAP